LESAIASASILFWMKNNGACRQHALLLAAQALRRATSVAEELNDRHLRGDRFEAEMRFSIYSVDHTASVWQCAAACDDT
jgi:hypothetical protein